MAAPAVGHIVHYQSYGTPGGEFLPEPGAAIVTAVYDEFEGLSVDLCVINPSGLFFDQDVPQADEPTPGHWNWPLRG